MAGRDDDALSWDDGDDPTLVNGMPGSDDESPAEPDPVAAAPATRQDPAATSPAAASPAASPAKDEEPHWALADSSAVAEADRAAFGNAGLIGLGVLGGVYALLTIGWIVGGLRLQTYAMFFVEPAAFQVSLWLAVLAPAAWFVSVWALTGSARPWVRILLLVAGALLLLPWPFIMVGAVGA